nr:hypothetical protein [Pandoravirus massiliensis]
MPDGRSGLFHEHSIVRTVPPRRLQTNRDRLAADRTRVSHRRSHTTVMAPIRHNGDDRHSPFYLHCRGVGVPFLQQVHAQTPRQLFWARDWKRSFWSGHRFTCRGDEYRARAHGVGPGTLPRCCVPHGADNGHYAAGPWCCLLRKCHATWRRTPVAYARHPHVNVFLFCFYKTFLSCLLSKEFFSCRWCLAQRLCCCCRFSRSQIWACAL